MKQKVGAVWTSAPVVTTQCFMASVPASPTLSSAARTPKPPRQAPPCQAAREEPQPRRWRAASLQQHLLPAQGGTTQTVTTGSAQLPAVEGETTTTITMTELEGEEEMEVMGVRIFLIGTFV